MARADLQSLPRELLEQICLDLTYGFSPSIYAFSMVNKKCFAAADVHVYRELRLPAATAGSLVATVKRWMRVLENSSRFRHVRHLKIKESRSTSFADFGLNAKRLEGLESDEDDFQILSPSSAGSHISRSFENQSSLAMAWPCVATLIRQLSGLTDLTFSCADLFPECLLDTLHQYHPSCRLHIRTFGFRGLISRQLDGSRGIGQYELKLASSPCLHSITTGIVPLDTIGAGDNSNARAVLKMLEHPPLGLKKIRLLDYTPPNMESLPRLSQGIPDLVSLQNTLEAAHPNHGRVTRLEMRSSFLSGLGAKPDFSDLTVLKLYRLTRDDVSHRLPKLDLPSLKTLVVEEFGHGIHNMPMGRAMNRIIAMWIGNLKPLVNLGLSGMLHRETLDSIFGDSNSRLRKFKFNPIRHSLEDIQEFKRKLISAADLQILESNWPNLTDLEIPIYRSKGDKDEVAIYRALGSMTRLKHISLNLNITSHYLQDDQFRPPLNASLNEISQESASQFQTGLPFYKGQVMNHMINCAVDEPLAREIFCKISDARDPCPNAAKVESLKLQTDLAHVGRFPGGFHDLVTQVVCEHMNGRYMCYRNPRDDTNEPIIQQIRQKRKQPPTTDFKVGQSSIDIFRNIWPADGNSDWKDDWHSLPLAND